MLALRLTFASLLAFGICSVNAHAQPGGVVVNGQPLTMQQIVAHGIQLPPGRYWYDPVSGLWGIEGKGYSGQGEPAIQIGGPLRSDASFGDTNVFVNGREIVQTELEELQAVCGPVPHGEYWLSHELLAGPVGGAPTCNVGAGSSPNSPGELNVRCSGLSVFEDMIACFSSRHGS